MNTIYIDKNHLIVLLEKDGLFKLWARVGNPKVSVSKRYRSWEIVAVLMKTPMGVYHQVYKDSVGKLNNVEKYIEKYLTDTLTYAREIEQLEKNPKLVKSIVDECLAALKIELFPELMP